MKKYYMLVNYYLLFVLSCLIFLQNSYADPILNIFFYPYPDVKEEDFHATLKKPGHIASHHVNGIMNHTCCAGIISTYCGYMGVSNADGQTIFPLHHYAQYMYIIITDAIDPVVMFSNTVSHLEASKHAAVAYFKATKLQDDKTGLFLWNVQQEVERPTDPKQFPRSLIIISKPDCIYVPIGVSPAENTSNWLLPPLYVKPCANMVENSLSMMNLSQFVSPVRMAYKKDATSYRMQPIRRV